MTDDLENDVPIIIRCPNCSRKLKVNDDLLGTNVRCPACQNTFTAEEDAPAEDAPPPPTTRKKASDEEGGFWDPGTSSDREETSSRRSSGRDDSEDDAPASRRRRRRDEDDDDDGPRRSGRRRRRREWTEPHRGQTILILGILGLVFFQPLGIAAWVMGNSDLQAMREGRMDPEGEGMTQGGRVCGIIATIVMILCGLCGLAYVAFVFVIIAGAASGGLK